MIPREAGRVNGLWMRLGSRAAPSSAYATHRRTGICRLADGVLGRLRSVPNLARARSLEPIAVAFWHQLLIHHPIATTIRTSMQMIVWRPMRFKGILLPQGGERPIF
jgi:hypothetical protein